MQIVKDITFFIIDIMKLGIYPLPFIFTILIIDQLKKFYGQLWFSENIKSLITLSLSLILNFSFVIINMMIIVTIFKVKFNAWIYILNSIGNFALACATVDMVDIIQDWIKNKFKKT